MGRDFRAYEFADGDLQLYAREEGEDDSAWRPVGRVKHKDRFGAKGGVLPTAKRLGLTLTGDEVAALNQELAWPRRW